MCRAVVALGSCRSNIGGVNAPSPNNFTDTLPAGVTVLGSVSGSPLGKTADSVKQSRR